MIGQTFTRDGGRFRVIRQYMPDMYECRSERGEIVIPADEIRSYQNAERQGIA